MGKRKQKNKNQQQDQNNNNSQRNQSNKANKRQKRGGQKKKGGAERCWIENCMESRQPKSIKNCDMMAILSRVELIDGHNPIGKTDTSSDVTPSKIDDGDNTKRVPDTSSPVTGHIIETTTEETDKSRDNNLVYIGRANNERGNTTSLDTTAGKSMNSQESITASSAKTEGVEDAINIPTAQTPRTVPIEVTTKEINKSCSKNGKEIDGAKVDDDEQVNTTTSETKTDKLFENVGPSSKISIKDVNKDYSHSFIKVIRAPSARWKPKTAFKKQKQPQKKFQHLPNGDAGDGIINPHPKNEVADKYWAQRKRLFSRFDQGIKLDKEGWFSVTPEAIANHIATRVAVSVSRNISQEQKSTIVLDAFCGCGGNAIAFALKSEISTVICVDLDINKLRMAVHNASIYDVDPNRLIFIEADATHIMEKYSEGKLLLNIESDRHDPNSRKDVIIKEETCKGYVIGGLSLLPPTLDAVFLSPPWGGMSYLNEGKMGYNISSCIKVSKIDSNLLVTDASKTRGDSFIDGEELLIIAAKAARHKSVSYFLPRNINGVSLGRSALKAGYTNKFELEQNNLNGKLKTITAYFHDVLDKIK